MAKQPQPRTYTAPFSDESRDQLIDRWIEIAGPLPATEFEIETFVDREPVRSIGTAREKLHSVIHLAVRGYQFGDGRRWLASKKQLVKRLRRIENASDRLLESLAGLDDVRFALSDMIREELASFASLPSLPTGYPNLSFSTARQLRMTVEAVDALHRWTKTAREQHEARLPRRAQLSAAGHRGNPALNRFVEALLEECWSGVWGRRIADGPVLWRFVIAGVATLGIRLSEDASRERIRRVLGRRGANQKGAPSDLPIGRPGAKGSKPSSARQNR